MAADGAKPCWACKSTKLQRQKQQAAARIRALEEPRPIGSTTNDDHRRNIRAVASPTLLTTLFSWINSLILSLCAHPPLDTGRAEARVFSSHHWIHETQNTRRQTGSRKGKPHTAQHGCRERIERWQEKRPQHAWAQRQDGQSIL